MRTNEPAAVRADFIIRSDQQLELAIMYPMTVGRNFAAVIRSFDALQPATSRDVAAQAHW